MIFIGLTICLPANTTSVSFFPETWLEIKNQGGLGLHLEQGIVRVGLGDYIDRGFWQFSIAEVAEQFASVDFVSFKVSNIYESLALHLYFREADFNPKLGDWTAYENNSFFQSIGYFTNPESEVDITAGFNAALELWIEN